MEKDNSNKVSGSGVAKADSLVSLGQWIWDRSINILSYLTGAGMMAYLASATDWINEWGPLAWGTIALLSFIIIMLTHGSWMKWRADARLSRAHALITEKSLDTSLINPLDNKFSEKRIILTDLAPPNGYSVKNKTLTGCELLGPATVYLLGGVAVNNNMRDVEFVKITTDQLQKNRNKVVLENCTLTNCTLYNLIILVHESEVGKFNEASSGEMIWLN